MTTTTTAVASNPKAQSGWLEARAYPAHICWSYERGYFVQWGDDESAEWFDMAGERIDRSKLFWSFDGSAQFRVIRLNIGCYDCAHCAVERATEFYSPAGYDMIYLEDNEWGNETMRRVCEEHFSQNPNCQFIECHEHGGWWLGFRRDGSVWSTANDMAQFDQPWPQPSDKPGQVVIRQ